MGPAYAADAPPRLRLEAAETHKLGGRDHYRTVQILHLEGLCVAFAVRLDFDEREVPVAVDPIRVDPIGRDDTDIVRGGEFCRSYSGNEKVDAPVQPSVRVSGQNVNPLTGPRTDTLFIRYNTAPFFSSIVASWLGQGPVAPTGENDGFFWKLEFRSNSAGDVGTSFASQNCLIWPVV
jgi:hypothetical protein